MPMPSTTGTTEDAVPDPRLQGLLGLIPTEVGEALWWFARETPSELAIVEIGSYKGKSACYLADGAGPHGSHVYAIDPWNLPGNPPGRFRFDQARATFDEQVSFMGFEDRITAIQGFGPAIALNWDRGVGLLFVDGDHTFDGVMADVRAWLPHLPPTWSVLVLDDLDTPKNPGVRRAAEKLSEDLGPYTVEAGRLAVFRL